jgi:hypothetical protein
MIALAPPGIKAALLTDAIDMLRHCSCDNASVLLHMLEVIDAVSQEAGSPEARQELLRHVSLIQAESQAGALIEQDASSSNAAVEPYKRNWKRLHSAAITLNVLVDDSGLCPGTTTKPCEGNKEISSR